MCFKIWNNKTPHLWEYRIYKTGNSSTLRYLPDCQTILLFAQNVRVGSPSGTELGERLGLGEVMEAEIVCCQNAMCSGISCASGVHGWRLTTSFLSCFSTCRVCAQKLVWHHWDVTLKDLSDIPDFVWLFLHKYTKKRGFFTPTFN